MKQQDIALIIVIAAISAGISYFASDYIFASGKNHEQEVYKIDPISAEFKAVNVKYFNAESINPTRLIKIGDTTNTNPFNGRDQ
jgi:hypothetical protein